MNRIVCAGDLMVDVLALLPGPLANGSDTPARVQLLGGGAAANVAAWAASAGASATFIGRVGDDALGRDAVAHLAAGGVDVRATSDPQHPTGTCIVLVDPSGERTMIPSTGANDAPLEVSALPSDADVLYLSGYPLLRQASRASALEMLAQARERGWSIAIDAASAAPLAAIGAETFLGWLGADIVLLANADEALVLTRQDDPVAAARSLAAQVGQAVVKLGPEGAVWSDGSNLVTEPAAPARVVDVTGAGDALAAGFLATSGSGPDRLANGVLNAARALQVVGARPPING